MVSLSNPDGMAMLLSGSGPVRTQAAIIPFSVEEMEIRQGSYGDEL